MTDAIQIGNLIFLGRGTAGVAAIRQIERDRLIVYVENAGDFVIPRSAVTGVHDTKVVVDPRHLPKAFLSAVGHAHDREDPNVAG